jgi:hypothetical protein
MAARTDIYEWLRLRRDDVLPWKRALYESDDPRTLRENALHLPMFLQHGAQDTLVPRGALAPVLQQFTSARLSRALPRNH